MIVWVNSPTSSTTHPPTNPSYRAVCDVKFSVPVDQAAQTKVESDYVSDVKTGKSGLEGELPDYADKIMPGQMVNLGYLISGPSAGAVKMGTFKVESAKFC